MGENVGGGLETFRWCWKAGLGTRGGAKSMKIGGQIVLKEGGNTAQIEEAERVI